MRRCLAAIALGTCLVIRAAHGQTPGTPLTAWQGWKDITAAIHLRPLDGPDDILEKAEIIEDRIDALSREGERIGARCALIEQALAGLLQQIEDLRELASLSGHRDSHARQRLHELSSRRHEVRTLAEGCRAAIEAMERERARLVALDRSYRARAAQLRAEEGRKR